MALKDCTFFVDVNGKQVEMDYDQFRAYLLNGTNLSALAPTLVTKKGTKVGFERAEASTAKGEAKAQKGEAAPKKGEAPTTQRGKVEVVTAAPAEAEKIEASVGKQKMDAQGFTPDQREFLIEKTREVYQEAQKPSAPERFVIKVPGDGQFTIKQPVDANGLHRRLTGKDVPGVDFKDKRQSDTLKTKKAENLGARGEAYSKLFAPFKTGFTGLVSGWLKKDAIKESAAAPKTPVNLLPAPETALYSLAQHRAEVGFENTSPDKEFITDGSVLVLTSAVKGNKAEKVKSAGDTVKRPEASKVRQVWTSSVNNATVPAEIAGVWQSSTSEGLALIDTPNGFITLSPERLNFAVKMTDADGILITDNATAANPVILTRNGEPVGMIGPFVYKTEEGAREALQGAREAIDEMKREGKSPTSLSANLAKPAAKTQREAAPEAKELPPNAPRPVTVENLRTTMGLSKTKAEAVMAVYKAMGLPLPKIRLAKGIEGAEGDLEQSAFHATRQPFTPEPGFPFGRFRLDKIGTGVGRQAQGWGIYLAAKRIRASDYLLDLRKTSPDAVLYDLDVPNKLVAQLPDDEKPLSRKLQVAVNRELKAAGIELTVDSAMSLRDIMDKIQQNAAWGSDANAPRLTSELLDRAGIPGLQRFVKDKLGLHMYVIWNQAALDRIALLGANGKKLQTLAQNGQTAQGLIRGSIEFLDETDSERLNGALAIIRGFSAANVTTPIHEGAHFYRRFMLNTENGFTAQEIKAAEDWAGAKNGNWSVAAEEKWARGFERYLRSGEAPLPSLTKLFEKLAKWFQNIYKTVIGSEIDVEITPEIRRVFDRIFELQAEKVKATGGERTLEQRVEAETKATPVATAPDLEKAALKWAGVSRITPAHSPKAGQLLREFTGLMDKLRNKLLNASADTWRTIPRTVFIASGFAFEQLQAELSGDLTPRKRAITKMYYADSQAAYIASSSTEGMRNNLAAKLQVNPQELHRLHDIYNVLVDYGRGASPEAKALGLADETTGNAQLHTLLTPPGQFTTGKPTLVTVYHGTSEEGIKGNEFAPSFAGALTDALSAKRGYFFAGSPITPWRYARTHMLMSNLTQVGRVFKFFVKLQNPLVYDMKGSHQRSRTYADLMAEAKNAGHDGVIITNSYDGGFMADTIVTVLHGHESQIKSAEPQVFTKEGKEIPLAERFSASRNILYQAKQERAEGLGPVWRSNIMEALVSWPQSKGTPAQLMAHLKNVKGATEEAKWVDLKSFLEGKASVTRAQVEEFIAKNPLVVDMVTIPESKADPKHLMARIKGGIDYRDVVITMPLQHQYTSVHFPEAPSYVAHMRVSSFTSKDGRKIFLVDELQSDLHQGARRYGYVTPQQREAAIKDRERAATYEREAEKARTLANEYTAYLSDNLDKPFNEWTGIRSEADATLQALRAGKPFPSTPLTAAISKAGLDDAFQRLIGLQKHADKMQKLADKTTPADFWRIARMAYPETPWKETAEWVTMAFKRAVRMAVDEGADVIAWTPGNVHAGRWGAKLHKFYDKILPQTLAKFVRQWGGKVETVTFDEPEFEVPLEWELVPEHQAQLDELNEQLQEAYEAEPFNEDVVKNLEDDIELFTLGATRIEVPTGKVKERTFPSISITPQMKAEAQKGFTLFQAEGSGGDSTAKARAEAIRQNRERMQARREQAGGDTSKQQKGGGTIQQQKGGSSAPRQGRTRSKPQTLSDMLRIAEEQVQAAAEREPQTDTEKRQAQAQRAVMALLRDYVRLKAQGNLPDTYTKADGTQVNREAELFDALTAMLDSATDPDDDARKATRKALSARFDEILPGRVKSKAGQPKTLQDMLREAERNIRGAAGKKVLSAQEKAQERADQEIKYLIREYAQKMYAGRLTDDLELPDGTTVSREQELLNALDALRDALKMPNEGLRLKARADAMRRVDFALLAPPLETRKQPLNIRNFLTGHAGWGRLTVRSPLSYLNYIGSYERIAGTTGRLVSDTFNEVRTRFARGQYRNFNSALADLRIQLRPLKQQLIDEGYGGLPEVIDAHVQRIEESSRNLGELSVANVKKAWQNGDLNLAANLVSSILKAFVFNAKLRLNPKSIGLNYLQPLFTLYPYFTSEEMVRLYKDSLNPDTRARVRDIAIAESGGRFTLEMQQGQTSRIPNPFTAASEQVRIMGHLAGEMLADRLKLPEGIERDMYIRSWAEKAEFDNSPWNAGPLFTGPIASVVLQFKPYMVKNLERFITDVKKNPVIGERISEKKQRITARRAKVLLVQAGIGGLSSLLTLAPPLRILAGPIMLGLLAKFIGGLADDEEVGERMAEVIYFGVPSAFALDLSSSVGFIEEPFGRSPADKFASALGPAVSMAYQGYTQADDIYELATRPQKVGESEAVKKELGERTWKLGKALTPYTRMVEAGYSLATGTRPEMFLDKETPLTTGETVGRLFGLSPVRQASYYEMKEAPDLAKRIVGMQPDIAGIPRERGETDKTYRVKVQRVTEWRNSYGKQLENHPRFKTLDKATKDKALEIINGNISAEAAKVKPNLSNLRPDYVIRRAKESIRQAPRRARRQMYVPPPED